MTTKSFQDAFARCTLETYETVYADRHLIHGAIAKWAREKPDHLALIDAETGQQYTYAELERAVTGWAIKLVELGLEPGNYLATMLPLNPEHILLEYACFQIGVIHAPLDLRLKAPEVIRALGLIQAQGFVCLGRTPMVDFTDLARAVRDECPYIKHFIQYASAGDVIEGALSAEKLLPDAYRYGQEEPAANTPLGRAVRRAMGSVKPTDGAQVIYTTGSTGMPKPALLSHRNITSQNMCLMVGFDTEDGPTQLVNLPPSHVGCQAEQLMTTFFSGGTAVILHVFGAEKTLRAIQEHRAEIFGQIPAMFHLEWQLPDFARYDLSSIRGAMFGGQTVTRPFVERLLEMVPKVGTGLGLTEMSGFVTYTGLTDCVEDVVELVGWAMPITPLSIREPMQSDGTAGKELPDGEIGDICFTGPQVFVDYVNDREAYRRTVSTDGVCYTGDLGRKTERGLYFAGRSKMVIKPKGYQVHPMQVEEHFAQLHDRVAICGAVGAPHETFGEAVILFAEKQRGAQLKSEELEKHAKGIAAYMRPLHYVVLEPACFPLNRVSKTDYVRLREMARAEIERLREEGRWDR